MVEITSKKNPLITHIRKLNEKRSYRYEMGEFVCDGVKLLGEAVAANAIIESVLVSGGTELDGLPEGAKVYRTQRDILKYASRLETPGDVLFVCKMRRSDLPDRVEGNVLLLDCVQDPGNVGTVMRTADAFGIETLLLINGCADPYNPKTVRSTMGAIFRQKFYETDLHNAVNLIKSSGKKFYGAALSGNASILGHIGLKNSAVAIGNEGNGLSRETLDAVDGRVFIPMSGEAESLNAAVAASIIMWEMTK